MNIALQTTKASERLPSLFRAVMLFRPDDGSMQAQSTAYLAEHEHGGHVWVYHNAACGVAWVDSRDEWAYWPW